MRNQIRYLSLYLFSILVTAASPFVLAQGTNQSLGQSDPSLEIVEAVELNQAELDQILAPIALYPDTLLSHILVASTYPLEVIQAARWRANNVKMDGKQALDAVEEKNWDPSVKALVPFNDLLQKFSQDLDWLQSLGDAFLLNEEQVLESVQNLRQKAYAQGNLGNNDYIEVSRDEGQIVIENVVKEVVYVPYYDTRVVYGNWWWGAHPPHYWHRPSHYVWSAGFYWSPSYLITPSFYFGGFHWANHHVVANYHYRNHTHHYPRGRRVVNVREYPRWNHNPQHRRGVRYNHQQNPHRFVNSGHHQGSKKSHQIDKQRVLNVENYTNKGQHSRQDVVINTRNSDRHQPSNEGIKRRLQEKQQVTAVRNESHSKSERNNVSDKKRIINNNFKNERTRGEEYNQQVRRDKSVNTGHNTQVPTATREVPQVQNNRSDSQKTRNYSSSRNHESKSRVQRNVQRHSTSERQQRQSKSTRHEQKR